jgi:hypothetical protein
MLNQKCVELGTCRSCLLSWKLKLQYVELGRWTKIRNESNSPRGLSTSPYRETHLNRRPLPRERNLHWSHWSISRKPAPAPAPAATTTKSTPWPRGRLHWAAFLHACIPLCPVPCHAWTIAKEDRSARFVLQASGRSSVGCLLHTIPWSIRPDPPASAMAPCHHPFLPTRTISTDCNPRPI